MTVVQGWAVAETTVNYELGSDPTIVSHTVSDFHMTRDCAETWKRENVSDFEGDLEVIESSWVDP